MRERIAERYGYVYVFLMSKILLDFAHFSHSNTRTVLLLFLIWIFILNICRVSLFQFAWAFFFLTVGGLSPRQKGITKFYRPGQANINITTTGTFQCSKAFIYSNIDIMVWLKSAPVNIYIYNNSMDFSISFSFSFSLSF